MIYPHHYHHQRPSYILYYSLSVPTLQYPGPINNIPTHPSLLIHTNTANAHFPMSQVHEGEMAALTQQLNFAFDEFNNGGQFNTSSFSTSTSMGPVSTQTLDIQMGPVSTQKLDIKGSF